jgi:hypothetical protein
LRQTVIDDTPSGQSWQPQESKNLTPILGRKGTDYTEPAVAPDAPSAQGACSGKLSGTSRDRNSGASVRFLGQICVEGLLAFCGRSSAAQHDGRRSVDGRIGRSTASSEKPAQAVRGSRVDDWVSALRNADVVPTHGRRCCPQMFTPDRNFSWDIPMPPIDDTP